MSTSHHGSYCQIKDKMILSEQQAIIEVKRMKGVGKYKCRHCGGWHLTSTKHTRTHTR
jgi:hypothetical protein